LIKVAEENSCFAPDPSMSSPAAPAEGKTQVTWGSSV